MDFDLGPTSSFELLKEGHVRQDLSTADSNKFVWNKVISFRYSWDSIFSKSDLIRKKKLVILSKLYGQSCQINIV